MAVPAYDWIGFHADLRPNSIALIDDYTGKTHTYSELNDRVNRMAAWLANRGVGEGARVAFLSENTIDIFEVLFACAHLKAILVPLNWRLAVPELQFIIEDSRPHVLIFEEQFQASVDGLAAPVCLRLGDDYEAALASADPTGAPPVTATHDDALAIMYTSGTTGHPKGALVTHRMFFYNAINIGDAVGLTHRSRNLNVLPTFHTGGLNLYTTPCLRLGGSSVNLREFNPERLLHWLSSGEITHFFGVPAVYQFLAEYEGWETADLSRVESWACGGSPMPVT
jgi:fatty-acyl-CoA synthase